MASHLSISVNDLETLINYVVGDEIIVSYTHPVGFKHLEADGLNTVARSKLVGAVIYVLEFISLHDRIPTHFYLTAPRHATWISESLQGASYAQFYTDGVPISVTLERTNPDSFSYARHTKTLFSFKI